ncbi:hypothetical protein B0H13DRAFT_1921008 [Mycena leptocephala]|nr:hypothetical protein B0H13DRAFT_1921008 [Mycena leptocephala]
MTRPTGGKAKPKPAPEKKNQNSCSRKKEVIEPVDDGSSDVESGKPRQQKVNWVNNPQWTDKLVAYLCEDPDFHKLFSDSTAKAKKEKRTKLVAKDGKAVQYAALAKAIFEDDPKEQARYLNDPSKYGTSVETRLRRLKKDYQKQLEILGATGAGFHPSVIREDSKLASLIACIRKEFPWWDVLHSFWRELPSYNPIGVQSLEPGIDHASAAENLFNQTVAGSDGETDASGWQHQDRDDGDEDDRSEASKARDAQDLEDTGGDDKSYSSSSDRDDEDDIIVESGPPRRSRSKRSPLISIRSCSRSPPPRVSSPLHSQTPPPAKKRARKESSGKSKAAGGHDLGLSKAAAVRSSVAKKKPQTAIDRLNDIRETESTWLAEKRKFQHTEEMERIRIKKMKYELKLMQAENDRIRLNRRAMSQSPR